MWVLFFFLRRNSGLGLGHLTAEVSRSRAHTHTHTHTHTHPAGLLRTSDQYVAEATAYTSRNKHRGISIPSAGFEHAIPVIMRPQTYAFLFTDTTRFMFSLPYLNGRKFYNIKVTNA